MIITVRETTEQKPGVFLPPNELRIANWKCHTLDEAIVEAKLIAETAGFVEYTYHITNIQNSGDAV